MPPGHESLRDAEATKDAILDALDWIMRAVIDTNDVAMVFLAGHGITTPDQHYRFLPYDYDDTRIERTTITDSELQDYLTKIGGKKIFFFDTCYSGDVLRGRGPDTRPDIDKFANELKASENGIVVFTSSTGNELSLEKDEWHNGAFTKALVEGLRGAAARPEVPVIMISDLQGYLSRRVKELTSGKSAADDGNAQDGRRFSHCRAAELKSISSVTASSWLTASPGVRSAFIPCWKSSSDSRAKNESARSTDFAMKLGQSGAVTCVTT